MMTCESIEIWKKLLSLINSPIEIEIIKIDERWAIFSVFNPKLFVLPFIGLCYENVRQCWRKLLPEASYISCLTSLSIFIDPGVFHNVNHKKIFGDELYSGVVLSNVLRRKHNCKLRMYLVLCRQTYLSFF